MEVARINTEKFWKVIDDAQMSSKNLDEFTRNMERELITWNYSELYDFQAIYESYEVAVVLYPNNLIWSALILINRGYCTNTYGFAGWLTANGKNVYLNTLKNADYLAQTKASKDKCNYEGLRFLAFEIFKKKTKGKIKPTIEELRNRPETRDHADDYNRRIAEIVYGNLNRNRDWTLKEMKPFLPDLYKKHLEGRSLWKILINSR